MIIFVTIKQVVTNHQLPSWSWSRSDQLVTRGLAILAPSSSLPSSLSSPPSSSSSLSLEYFIFRQGELLGHLRTIYGISWYCRHCEVAGMNWCSCPTNVPYSAQCPRCQLGIAKKRKISFCDSLTLIWSIIPSCSCYKRIICPLVWTKISFLSQNQVPLTQLAKWYEEPTKQFSDL